METTDNDLSFQLMKPIPRLADFVESFWMLVNHSEKSKDIIVLPDGRFDLLFSYAATEPYHVTLTGLGVKAEPAILQSNMVIFAISFKLLALEYLFDFKIASLLNEARRLPSDFWGITPDDLHDFETFCTKVSTVITGLLKTEIDSRKQKLFDAIYTANGTVTVNELSEQVYWSSRQINRYFNQQFGLSLKTYCTILRFRASFTQLKEGRLFPEEAFADQAHFIKDVKRFSGVAPKELFKNKNDRFIQFTAWPKK